EGLCAGPPERDHAPVRGRQPLSRFGRRLRRAQQPHRALHTAPAGHRARWPCDGHALPQRQLRLPPRAVGLRPEPLSLSPETALKIGKATVPQSAICAHNPETIVVRGQDLCQDLIGQVGFADYFYLLLTGLKPDAAASAVLNATLVAIAEHGLVPSVQAARMTLAAAPDALQGAVAAGILGCGSVILGASETAGRLFDEIHRTAPQHGDDLPTAARAVVGEWRARKQAIPGYGHPVH